MKIVVYCGASTGQNPAFKTATQALGQWIVAEQHTLVYGGGKVGLMGLLADTVLAGGAKVIGIMPTFLAERELSHPQLTELQLVESMSERKNKMIALGDCYIALPGGPGTLEEIAEVISWARIGQHQNACILYNVADYYTPLAQFYDQMVANGFLTATDRSVTSFSSNVTEIAAFLKDYQPPVVRQYQNQSESNRLEAINLEEK
ncbi:LOG family protein [Brochothrix campestris]|uniref:Cytokinin riboside 5'-monophosphate phosphoribohydrolase n=1 Tax=Brochothrix campestris FSL F6-1037 TaxID=1265861 RepID=W7CCQ6_9LIST|nr:TIGR00730 family Rossman fold protein [Brochothrix campestris]EUJ37109.1 decarboxylase [Brochothrix campestris FSL F6-1037]